MLADENVAELITAKRQATGEHDETEKTPNIGKKGKEKWQHMMDDPQESEGRNGRQTKADSMMRAW